MIKIWEKIKLKQIYIIEMKTYHKIILMNKFN
jgi:hypothetical protein